MRILFGIQATGYGHITRARAIIPYLQHYGEVEILLSGYHNKLELSYQSVRRKRGIGFTYDRFGRISILDSFRQLRLSRFITDIRSVHPYDYDLIISDFEPVTAWGARLAGKNCLGLSHQAAFLSSKTPRPLQRSSLGELIFHHYAPVTNALGFHFLRYDDWIEPPVIRQEVLELHPKDHGHVSVYLPAFSHATLTGILRKVPEIEWEIFAPDCDMVRRIKNVTVMPISFDGFLKSLETCHAVLCGAGFETCAEALYLGKKLLVIPVGYQYEQRCNAAALKEMGVMNLEALSEESVNLLRHWVHNDTGATTLPAICDVKQLVNRIVKHEDCPESANKIVA